VAAADDGSEMHTARQLDRETFAVRMDGRPASREDLLPGWHAHDRLGVVMTEPFGAIGASYLIQLAITAYYDLRPQTREVTPPTVESDLRALYPEIYLFHVGGPHGDHSAFDFWPGRKEVFLEADARLVLDAVNDRAITRLAVPDAEPVPVRHEFKEPAAAHERIVTVLAYSPTGRVDAPDFEVAGVDRRAEANVRRILDPDERYKGLRTKVVEDDFDDDLRARTWPSRSEVRRGEAWDGLELANARREAIRVEGVATETYRVVALEDALSMLVPTAVAVS
jgi:hypothetical protein